MLLSKTATVKWNGNNKSWFENKGYKWTKASDEFEVRVEDLTFTCNTKVVPICDVCNKQRKEPLCYCNYHKNIIKNNGKYICPSCFRKISGINRRKTHEHFLKEVFSLVGNEYAVLGNYETANKKLKMKHNCDQCDNHEWEITPAKFLLGRRCPKCANNIKKGIDNFKKELSDKFGDEYTVLGEYKNTDTPIRVRHNSINCGYYEWETPPKIILKGESKCPKCSKKMKKTTEYFKEEVYKLVGSEYEVLGEYVTAKTRLLMKHNCDDCNNYKWMIQPSNFLTGKRCPACSESKGEKRILEYLIKNGIKNIPQKEFEGLIGLGGRNLSYDFYLPKYNLLIEYQGEFHDGTASVQLEEDFIKQQEHDERKRRYAKKHYINLLEIWYWNFDNIEKILKQILKENSNKVS